MLTWGGFGLFEKELMDEMSYSNAFLEKKYYLANT